MNREIIIRNIPLAGVFAFAIASVWSLYQMFNNHALHPTWLYWIPAALVEVVTAWLVYQVVESVRQITRTHISNQDRKFNKVLAIICIALALPTLIVSGAANFYEFRGSYLLAPIFPISCVACAVATAIPHIKVRNIDARLEQEREAVRREREKTRKVKEEIEQQKAEVVRLKAQLAQKRAMSEPSREAFDEVCASLNGGKPENARGVNKLLNDYGYYAVPSSTARTWVK